MLGWTRISLVSLLLAAILLASWPLGAATPEESFLERYFASLQTLRANFEQIEDDPRSGAAKSSRGTVLMARPGRFRWDYSDPYEQVIVADGERLWHYDVDLEQVSVRRMDESLGKTPLAVLVGGRPLRESFIVTKLSGVDGGQWYQLEPRDEEGSFESARVGFANGELIGFELDDALGQTTRLRFSEVERNIPLSPKALEFVPPDGVDVVGDV